MLNLFNYILKPANKCLFPEASDGRKSIAWYWLTDSNYYIQFNNVKLFESSKESQKKYNEDNPFLEYLYARFLEDFFDILPQISMTIPREIYQHINTAEKYETLRHSLINWYASIEEPTEEQEMIERNIQELLWFCHLDTGYLAYQSRCCFYRIDNTVYIQYDFRATEEDGVPVWSTDCGNYEISFEDFLHEVEDLLNRFFRDMDKQVEDAIPLLDSQNYVGYEISQQKDKKKGIYKSSIEYLQEEHARSKKYFWDIYNKVKENSSAESVNWDGIKTSVEFLLNQKK